MAVAAGLTRLSTKLAPIANREHRRRWRFLRRGPKAAILARMRAEVDQLPDADRRVALAVFMAWEKDAANPQHSGTLMRGGHAMAAATGYKRRRIQHAYDVLGAGSVSGRRRSRPATAGHDILVVADRRGGVARWKQDPERGFVVVMKANEFSPHPRFLAEQATAAVGAAPRTGGPVGRPIPVPAALERHSAHQNETEARAKENVEFTRAQLERLRETARARRAAYEAGAG